MYMEKSGIYSVLLHNNSSSPFSLPFTETHQSPPPPTYSLNHSPQISLWIIIKALIFCLCVWNKIYLKFTYKEYLYWSKRKK